MSWYFAAVLRIPFHSPIKLTTALLHNLTQMKNQKTDPQI
jgi:hypothetical protein